MRTPIGLVLHHSGSRIDTVSGIRKYHAEILKWADIGYTWLMDRDGIWHKGRSIYLQTCNGNRYANKNYLSACVLGDFSRDRMSVIQKKALFEFLTYLKLIFDWGFSGIFGHKEVRDKPTLCPGKYFPLDECKEIFTDKGGGLK